MGQYATVTWSPGDEAVGQKFQQMAQNEEWLKENIIIGNLNFMANDIGELPDGRSPGAVSATKLEVVQYRFNSQVAVSEYEFRVNFPPSFTQPPVVLFSNQDLDDKSVIRMVSQTGTEYANFKVWHTDGLSKLFVGMISIALIGQ